MGTEIKYFQRISRIQIFNAFVYTAAEIFTTGERNKIKMDPSNIDSALILKETIYSGTKYIELKPGTKIKFHFETKRADNSKVIDDSRKINKPFDLVLGKKFKLEVWEGNQYLI